MRRRLFRGGRDSSAILAVAALVARREGLPLPVPVTNRFPDVASTDESEWQVSVVTHLGLADWACLDHRAELDVIGPVAGPLLRRYGRLWPFNSHFLRPVAALAPGGTVLTGLGGDELFATPWPGAVAAAMAARTLRPNGRRLRRVALAAGPRAGRVAAGVARPFTLPWLRPAAGRRLAWDLARWDARIPFGFERCLRLWSWPSRYMQTAQRSLALVAADAGATAVHPFSHPSFLAALGAARGWRGYVSRDAAMADLFGDVLPAEVLTRSSKAEFMSACLAEHSRRWVDGWTGDGVDGDLVDPHGLRIAWSDTRPDARALLALQAAWLATDGSAGVGAGAGLAGAGLADPGLLANSGRGAAQPGAGPPPGDEGRAGPPAE